MALTRVVADAIFAELAAHFDGHLIGYDQDGKYVPYANTVWHTLRGDYAYAYLTIQHPDWGLNWVISVFLRDSGRVLIGISDETRIDERVVQTVDLTMHDPQLIANILATIKKMKEELVRP
jgi:hypothetical protein